MDHAPNNMQERFYELATVHYISTYTFSAKYSDTHRRKPMTIKFDMIGIFVEDIQMMVDFYTNAIGLETDWNREGPLRRVPARGHPIFDVRALRAARAAGSNPEFPQRLNGTLSWRSTWVNPPTLI
jgi:hypothetical protein